MKNWKTRSICAAAAMAFVPLIAGAQTKPAEGQDKSADTFWGIRGKLFPQFQHTSTSGATPVGTSSSTLGRTPDGKEILGYTEVNPNSSRLRIYGWRKLGKDMRAIWQVESEIPLDEGGGTFATRDSFVGLSGRIGTIKIGRIETPFKDLHGIKFYDGTDASDVISKLPFASSGSTASFSLRPNNVVQYEAPKFGEVRFRAMYVPDETKTLAKNAWLVSYGASLGDDEGPYYLSLAHEVHNDYFGGSTSVKSSLVNGTGSGSSFVPGAGVHSRDWGLRATGSYLFAEKTRVGVALARFTWKESGGAAGRFESYTKNTLELNVQHDFGFMTGTLMTAWAVAGECKLFGGVACTTDGLKGTSIHAALDYPLWEGVSLGAIYQTVINGPAAQYDSVSQGRPSPGSDSKMFGVRITYRF